MTDNDFNETSTNYICRLNIVKEIFRPLNESSFWKNKLCLCVAVGQCREDEKEGRWEGKKRRRGEREEEVEEEEEGKLYVISHEPDPWLTKRNNTTIPFPGWFSLFLLLFLISFIPLVRLPHRR